MVNVKAVTYNVKGLNHHIKRRRILNVLKQGSYDVIFLQETHIKNINEKIFKANWVGEQYVSPGTTKSRGTAIIFNKHTMFECADQLRDTQGRYILIKVKLHGETVTLGSVYAPNEAQAGFFENFFSQLQDFKEGKILLGGDFNCVPDLALDKTRKWNATPLRNYHSRILNKCLQEQGLVDLWRTLYPTAKDYTFYSAVHKTHSRIDLILASQNLIQNIPSAEIGLRIWSDHAPVTCTIIFGKIIRQTYSWRLNCSLLYNKEIMTKISEAIEFYFKENTLAHTSATTQWDAFKSVIRGRFISLAAYVKKKRELQRENLIQEIAKLETEYKYNGSAKVYKNLMTAKKQLEILEVNKIEKAMMYTKQTYFEFNNKASKLLARYIKIKQQHHQVTTIRNQKGTLETHPEGIAEVFRSFYKTLYQSEKPLEQNIEQYMRYCNMTKITEEHKQIMEQPITKLEVQKVIQKLKNGKTPGVDGFPGEFYKHFGEKFMLPMLDIFNNVLNRGQIPETWKITKIIAIPKQGKDLTSPQSYRPISLINQDAKIFTSILANRLNTFIAMYIQEDQTGFIKGRHMADNVRRLLNIMQHAQKFKIPSIILSVDAEKAFDRLEWPFLKSLLTTMDFGPNFCRVIDSLYSDAKACVSINRIISAQFDLTRGTRQGCPLSPILFALSLEPIANAIRQNADIKGVWIGQTQHKIGLYADDIILFVNDPETTLPAIVQEFSLFSASSGFKINIDKTEILEVYLPQSLIEYLKFHFEFKWVTKSLNYLGVQVTTQLSQLFKYNYIPLMKRINKKLRDWSRLNLS